MGLHLRSMHDLARAALLREVTRAQRCHFVGSFASLSQFSSSATSRSCSIEQQRLAFWVNSVLMSHLLTACNGGSQEQRPDAEKLRPLNDNSRCGSGCEGVGACSRVPVNTSGVCGRSWRKVWTCTLTHAPRRSFRGMEIGSRFYFSILISTRRFRLRPSSLSLPATKSRAPFAATVIRSGSIPLATR